MPDQLHGEAFVETRFLDALSGMTVMKIERTVGADRHLRPPEVIHQVPEHRCVDNHRVIEHPLGPGKRRFDNRLLPVEETLTEFALLIR